MEKDYVALKPDKEAKLEDKDFMIYEMLTLILRELRMANQKWSATKPLLKAGVNLKLAGGTYGLGKLHHKLMVIDDSVTIFGSFNYTRPANRSNDENILVVGDIDETIPAIKNKQKKIGITCRREIERIAVDHGSDITTG